MADYPGEEHDLPTLDELAQLLEDLTRGIGRTGSCVRVGFPETGEDLAGEEVLARIADTLRIWHERLSPEEPPEAPTPFAPRLQ